MKAKRFFLSLLVILVGFFGTKFILDKLVENQKDLAYKDIPNYNDDAVKTADGEYLILLVGVDKNGDDDKNTDFTRTDTIMLLKADTKTGKMDLMSIPRDSRIKIRDKFDKVNHAHAFGGIELTMQTLRSFLGLDIDYYVQINYQALINIVDALGGVDYEVPEGISIDKGKVQIKPGLNHLDGNEVMWYLRTRNIYNNGDIGRVNTQQGFVKAMVDEIVKKSKNMNIMTFISNYLQYVKTNLPMMAIMDLAGNINNFSSDKMDTHIVPGMEQTIDGTSYYIPDFEKTWKIVDEVFPNFKLKNWEKEDSGYQEYEHYDEIKDESTDRGLHDENKQEETKTEEAPLPKTKTIEEKPVNNEQNQGQAQTQDQNNEQDSYTETITTTTTTTNQDMLDESLNAEPREENADE
ncbi:LCP family protein [Anaerococcus sp. mt242]|uniref:LCP family protein n=1 Tax=Anaerococcus sp. mt242 TaxID=2661917 RepID=UPI001931EC2F|nr:LCP family protein [Anaerococcus sp. mt242]MBM0045559.1 LCP family protein [Anaerococcus sp. mt242]